MARLTTPDDPLALLFVTGASGSGKSSFVQAGVLPALEKHYAALSVKWAVFRPSRDPLAALAEQQVPGWLKRLLTHPVQGLENYAEMMRLLIEEKNAIKVFVEVSGDT